jgi:hypothetical protein
MTIPVFILGLTQRSGTNLLYRALLQHPDCAPARQPGEDYLLHEADLLTEYVSRVASHWNPDWNRSGARASDLAHSLGAGLVAHLRPYEPCRVFVSKTPSVRNVGLLASFVPDARILVVVRDGRDVVESGVLGLGWRYRDAFQRWAQAADELVRFLEQSERPPVTVIRFESLVETPQDELGRALTACGLDLGRYPFEALAHLPVYGSSVLRGDRAELHWEPVSRPEDFDPVGRWKSWEDSLKREYDHVCGEAAQRLGYPRDAPASRGLAARLRGLVDPP